MCSNASFTFKKFILHPTTCILNLYPKRAESHKSLAQFLPHSLPSSSLSLKNIYEIIKRHIWKWIYQLFASLPTGYGYERTHDVVLLSWCNFHFYIHPRLDLIRLCVYKLKNSHILYLMLFNISFSTTLLPSLSRFDNSRKFL